MRYDRQIILPEVGEEGQKKLGEAKVLLIGVGGLGSPIALYLAAAGIGRIGIVNNKTVLLEATYIEFFGGNFACSTTTGNSAGETSGGNICEGVEHNVVVLLSIFVA